VSLSHHLAAVWFADIVGYTRLSEENEGEAVRLVHVFQRVAREVVAHHGGRVVKLLGDGALAEFPSTDQAVRSAEALTRAFAAEAKAAGSATGELRIGVHVGDVVATEDGDLYGDGVNVASRIQAAGDPGEVWVSEDVRRQLRQRPEFRFESRGERELKGLKRPLAMHTVQVLDAVTWTPSGETAGRRDHRRALSFLGVGILIAVVALGASTWFLGRGSDAGESGTVLAVLPFENLSGDEATEPFVLGVHDDLLTHLSRIGTLKVISRTSVMGYEGSTKSVPEIAKELGATAVVEGGIQRSGDRIRMNVQLIDARTDEHLWAEQFDRTLSAGDVFAIQGEIAERIADALEATLTPQQKADLAEAPTQNLEALDLYYQGRVFYRGRSGYGFENARRAERSFAEAVEADPEFAEAWAALVQARSWQLRNGVATDTTGARAALDRAVALAPDAHETALAEGAYLYYAKGDFEAAAERFENALTRWPGDAEMLIWQAWVLRRLGRWTETLQSAEAAREADPRNPNVLTGLAEILQDLRRFDEAERTFDQVLALNPNEGASRYWKFHLLLYGRGDTLRARRFLEASADAMSPAGYASLAATLAFFERDYEAGIAALEGQPVEPDFTVDAPYQLAMLSRWAGRPEASRVWADSLLASAERMIARYRSTSFDPFASEAIYVSFRGIAHALSGRREDAVRDGRWAAEKLPLSKDAAEAPRILAYVATIYVLVEDREAALEILDALVSHPNPWMAAGRLRLDPTYDPLRDDSRFEALIRKAEAAERSGTGAR
jgi:class 3 adenylate cyclase/TolB-like protein/Tfp pilus assembly protein PilF